MTTVYRDVENFTSGGHSSITVHDGRVIADTSVPASCEKSHDIIMKKGVLFPGFVDVHVHLREPGFSYKETIRTGTLAAAHGGYTAVCAMPNLSPVPDTAEHLRPELEAIRRDAVIQVLPYGALTAGQSGKVPAALEEIADSIVAFSDDGRGVQSEEMMRTVMLRAKQLGKVVAAHCEDNALLHGGCIHDGAYAHAHSYPGICSESEWGPIARDLRLAEETGCAYHVCHISCKESVELIRRAKAHGVNVSCETAPHYLLLDDNCLEDDGRFKMNPPLRAPADRQALLEGLADGTIDMIATDHAPHSAAEKSGGLRGSLNGIVGLETAFAVLYTNLVQKGIISLEKLIELMTSAPRHRFGIPLSNGDFTIFDLEQKAQIQSSNFLSKGRSTPFDGWTVSGKCMLTAAEGSVVWQENLTEN